ncbi:uncharacterized protein LOC117102002 isoform X1 [Anneissia japonica]|uniref:uncharacterized protein LOC117102002 isoform X1 n=1 Tax=Anneissia japonica TaxID=1529436 RepID=UPI0014256D42|nr:uncharacterized protein LOC117102002 isoform X1 [Anneissia japonica]XP_033098105.1 uncharacterized protein LOC117102002 isoform X1 [Anneissia japonica]
MNTYTISGGEVHDVIFNSQSSFDSLSHVPSTVRDLLRHPNSISKCRENPLTGKGKRIQLAKMLFLTLVPILSLAILAIINLHSIFYTNSIDTEVRNVIGFSRDIGVLLSQLQRERDMSALYVSLIGPEDKVYLTETYPLTDESLESLNSWPVKTSVLKELKFFRKKEDFKLHLDYHRQHLHRSNTTVYTEIEFYTELLQIFIDWLYESIGNSKGHDMWQTLVAYQFLIVSNIDMGIERTLGSIFFTLGGFDEHEDFVWYLDKFNVGTWNFKASMSYSTLVSDFYYKEMQQLDLNVTQVIEGMRRMILRNNADMRSPNFNEAKSWFELMTIYINVFENIQKDMAEEILIRLNHELKGDQKAIAVSTIVVVVVSILCPLTLRSIWTVTTDIQSYALTLAAQTKDLNKEKKRSNWLLYSMLPKTVVEQLMMNMDVKAELFDNATIFFSDIVGFNQLCNQITPLQVVQMLNGLYSVFDSRIENYDVYKVETINETYMLASGLPERNGDKHVIEIATAALDILYHTSFLEVPDKMHTIFQIRIGIHSGPVVAGVVGLKMPRYCLFGDTVNTASRMQTRGKPNRIQVSKTSHDYLLKCGEFQMLERGEVEIKGKGGMTTFWLIGRQNFNQLVSPDSQIQSANTNGQSIHNHRYEHLYDQMCTGRIQVRDPKRSTLKMPMQDLSVDQ